MAPTSLSLPLLASPGPSASVSRSSSCSLPASPLSLGSGRGGPSLALAAAPAPGGRPDSRWRAGVSSFSFLTPFLTGKRENDAKKAEKLKEELLAAIAPLDRGAEASPEDKERVEQIVRQLEAVNQVKEPLKSDLLNGKWELLYTTSTSILQPQRPKFLRPFGKIYQAINADTLRAQNKETWPYFNQGLNPGDGAAHACSSSSIPLMVRVSTVHHRLQDATATITPLPPRSRCRANQVTANLVPLNPKRVAVKFDYFKIFSLIPIKAPGSGKGELEVTYLDEELRISRGDKGNLFILKMVDPTYRVPLSTE